MALPTFFNCFVSDLSTGKHSFLQDDIRVALATAKPDINATSFKSIKETPQHGGYKTGGKPLLLTLVEKKKEILIYFRPVMWRAIGGELGPMRYVIVYNRTSDRLIGFYGYGGAVTLLRKETFTFTPRIDDKDRKLHLLKLSRG